MTEYYLQVANNGFSIVEIFWAVERDVAHQYILPSETGTHRAELGEEMLTTLRKRFQGAEFYRMQLAPGEYFPRMARPTSTLYENSPGYNPDTTQAARNTRTTSTGQLHALIQELQQICKTVYPIEGNFTSYGHEIRNLIIIASTEVEAQCKNILKANGVNGRGTLDYVKLESAMKLGKYRAALTWYPWLDPICPFENWAPGNTTSRQLPWYNSYNKIKHDRESYFSHATLVNALKSVTACFVMLCAQYGLDFARKEEAGAAAFFQLVEWPQWEPSEIYIPPVGALPTARSYAFGP